MHFRLLTKAVFSLEADDDFVPCRPPDRSIFPVHISGCWCCFRPRQRYWPYHWCGQQRRRPHWAAGWNLNLRGLFGFFEPAVIFGAVLELRLRCGCSHPRRYPSGHLWTYFYSNAMCRKALVAPCFAVRQPGLKANSSLDSKAVF